MAQTQKIDCPKKSIPGDQDIAEIIRGAVGDAQYSSWIAPCRMIVGSGTLELSAPNQFSADYVSKNFKDVISHIASGFGLKLDISCNGHAPSAPGANDNLTTHLDFSEKSQVRRACLDDFISDDGNFFALSACKKMLSGSASFSPLFVHGPSGCGKSLLASAMSETNDRRVLFMTGSKFVSEFVRALDNRAIFQFKDFIRNCDLFVMDDVQDLAGKKSTCEEFLSFLCDMARDGKSVALFSNAAPNSIPGMDRRLQSVMSSGLSVDIPATSAVIIKKMMRDCGLNANDSDSLASVLPHNGHIAAGVVKKLRAYRELISSDVSLEIAETLLSDVLEKSKTPLQIAREISMDMGASFDMVCSASRTRPIVRARQAVMWVLKRTTGLSLSQIGRMLGNRDHATVLYGISQFDDLIKTDLTLRAKMARFVEH